MVRTLHRQPAWFIGCIVSLIGILALSGCKSPEERAQAYYESGIKLLQEGKPAKASLEFRNALKLKDDFVPALYSLGLAEERQGRFDKAARIFFGVTERAPNDLDSRTRLAAILLMAGQLDDASKFADQAYSLAPSNPDILALKAAVAFKLENTGDALKFADAALEINPRHVDALMVRAAERLRASDPEGALAFLDRSGEDAQSNLSLQLLRVNVLSALKDEEGIERVFKAIIKLHPKEKALRQTLARWYISQGRNDDAEKTVRQFAAQNPDDVDAELELIAFLKSTQGLDAAKKELESRIEKGGNTVPFKMALAQLTFDDGDDAAAFDQMRRLIAETDDASAESISAKVQLAQMMLTKKNNDEALELAESVLEQDSKNVDALAIRAYVRMNGGDVGSAIEDLRAATNEAPQSERVMQLLAEAYERNGDVSLAEEQYAKAVKAKGNPQTGISYANFLLRYGKLDQADRVLSDLRATAPRNKQVLTKLAQLKLAKQDWVGAQELSDAVRELGGEDESDADRLLAAALVGEKKFVESTTLLESHLAEAKDKGEARAALIRGYLAAGNTAKAEELLETILASNPDDEQARLLLGRVYMASDRPKDAETTFKAIIEKTPSDAASYAALGELYLSGKDYDKAEKVLRDGLQQKQDDNVLRLLLAMTLERDGQYDAAIAEYETMLAADPNSTIAANNLASLLSDHGNDPGSLDKAYTIARRFSGSEVPQFLDTLGWIEHLRGNHTQALPLLRTAVDKLPEGAATPGWTAGMIQYHLAMTYKALGETDRASDILKKAIESLPDGSPEGSKARAALKQLVSTEGASTGVTPN